MAVFFPRLTTWFTHLELQGWFDELFVGSSAGSPPSVFPWVWLTEVDDMILLRRNTASQVVGVQMITAADGSAFTSTISVSVTLDGGAQASGGGSVTHEGNGYHTYLPTQAETNANIIGFTFTGSGAVPRTVLAQGVSFNPFDAAALGLTNLDATISSRLSTAGYTAPLDAAGTRAALGLASANVDTQLSGIQSDTNDIQTRLPASLVSGRMDASVGAMGTGVLTATAIAADAITAAKVAADVTTEIQTGLATAASITSLDAKIGTPTNLGSGATLAGNLVDIEAQTDDIGAAGAGLTALGDARLGNLDATVSSRLSTAGYTAPPTVAAIADGVWDEATTGHTTAGSFGEQVKTDIDAILDDTGTAGVIVATNNDKTGYAIGAGGIGATAFASGAINAAALAADAVDEILDEQIGDSTITMRQALKLVVATLGGKVSGAGTTTITFRNAADTTDVVVATVDGAGNRTAITRTL